jgi:hypothetical protein
LDFVGVEGDEIPAAACEERMFHLGEKQAAERRRLLTELPPVES